MENKVFQNGITNIELKESLGDCAISLLINEKIINSPNELKHLVVEFGYLLITDKPDNPCAMFKVIIPKKIFRPQKVYYFGTQDGKLLLLNENFTEEAFKKVQNDMFTMHKIDALSINKNDYKMELY